MVKAATIDAIKNYDDLDGKSMVLDEATHQSTVDPVLVNCPTLDTPVQLPKIQLILTTKSAEAGINGKFLKHGKVGGFPSLLCELVQQLGRLNRGGTDPAGSNVYEIYVDFYSYVSLFVQIM